MWTQSIGKSPEVHDFQKFYNDIPGDRNIFNPLLDQSSHKVFLKTNRVLSDNNTKIVSYVIFNHS